VAPLRQVETSSHWGTYLVEVDERGQVVAARPHADDHDAAPAIANVVEAQRTRARVARPAVRRRWLERGPGPDPCRGDPDDEYVELDWPSALDLLAAELDRVRSGFGNGAIYGGSYGWGSAGRFQHAQSQLHRFLNRIGGYVRSVNDYSRGSSVVLQPYVVGKPGDLELRARPVSWRHVAEHTELLVSFGGLRRSNTWVVPGGHNRHVGTGYARRAGASTRIVSLSAQRDDAFDEVGAEWIGVMPGTDTAVILALIHVLITDGLADEEFLDRYTVGSEVVRDYVLGRADGVPKTPEWAEAISRAPAGRLRRLAHEMASRRTLVNVVFALQRGEHGEQPIFAALTLAAFLGQIGLPGGGYTHGFGSMGDFGVGFERVPLPTFPQGQNPVAEFIPCARIADMLLHPGEEFRYDGQTLRYPEIRLAYWAGGNPFHHHQDLRRLTRAFGKLDTFVVNEMHWTPTAKHADIVLPVATALERDDIAAGAGDARLRVSRRAVEPRAQAREEFEIFRELARRMEVDFTDGIEDARAWLERIYEDWRAAPGAPPAPPFGEFWEAGGVDLPQRPYDDPVFFAFRADPEGNPLATPSGRIELYSQTLADHGLLDAPGHATWLEPSLWWGGAEAAEFDLHMLCNQPSNRLHSQQDMGAASRATKVAGREPIRLNPLDASARGLRDGDVARVRSPRGSLLAGVIVTDALLRGVAQMHTGAWYDPSAPEIADCVGGNVNVLTRDRGTSSLAQGCSGAHVLVAVERYDGPLPPTRAYTPPPFASRP
jgi:biotin/methionine sulfoxide reductase